MLKGFHSNRGGARRSDGLGLVLVGAPPKLLQGGSTMVNRRWMGGWRDGWVGGCNDNSAYFETVSAVMMLFRLGGS